MKESWKIRERSDNVLSASENLKKLKNQERLILKSYKHFKKNKSKNSFADFVDYLNFRNKYYQDNLSKNSKDNTILKDLGYNSDFLVNKYLEKNKRKAFDNIVDSHNISIDFYDSIDNKNDFDGFVHQSNDFEYN